MMLSEYWQVINTFYVHIQLCVNEEDQQCTKKRVKVMFVQHDLTQVIYT